MEPVFQATKVSRDILMFQMMVVDIFIGDIGQMLKEIEATNYKLPDRLAAEGHHGDLGGVLPAHWCPGAELWLHGPVERRLLPARGR